MADLYKAVIASKHRLEDVLPPEMHDYFVDAVESNSDMPRQIKELQKENHDLQKALDAEKRKNDEISEAYSKDVLTENKLLKHQIAFHERSANKYKKDLDRALAKLKMSDDEAESLSSLRKQTEEYAASLAKVIEENRHLHDLVKDLEDEKHIVEQEKEIELEDMSHVIQMIEEERDETERQMAEEESTYEHLIAALENEAKDSATQLRLATERQRQAEKLNAKTITEIRALKRFFQLGTSSVVCFKTFFRQFIQSHANSGQALPKNLVEALKNAHDEQAIWDGVREILESEHDGFEEEGDGVHVAWEDLKDMGESSRALLDSMIEMAADYDAFLEAIEKQPRSWPFVKSKSSVPKKTLSWLLSS
jgi:DNA repair exonuclease SbcCD ATPase subunit